MVKIEIPISEFMSVMNLIRVHNEEVEEGIKEKEIIQQNEIQYNNLKKENPKLKFMEKK
jgi:hypothetical protein